MNLSLAIRPAPSTAGRVRIAALVAAALSAAPATFAQATLFTMEGANAGDQLGGASTPVGDVTGDGVIDFLVSEPRYDGKAGVDCGRVQLFEGRKKGMPKPIAAWEGAKAGDRFGEIVRDVRDLDGDGVDDFALASLEHPGGVAQGMVDVISGKTRASLFKLLGENAGDRFGRVCGVGDATNDSVPDVLISAVDWNKAANGIGAGRVYLCSGKDGTLHKSWDGVPGQELGFRLAAANCDLFGDAGNEVVMSSRERGRGPWYGGQIEIRSGTPGDSHVSQIVYSVQGGDLAYMSDAVDYDGDGLLEFLIAAPGRNGGLGWIELMGIQWFNGIAWWNGTAELPYDGEVAMAGDVDGDGFGDFLFSSTAFDGPGGADVGAVQLVSGWHGRELTHDVSPEPGAPIGGESMVAAGDLNGDKRPDWMFGAPGYDTASQYDIGKAWARAGDDLFLTLSHQVAYANDFVTVSVTAGHPGNPLILALTELDGVPLFLPMLATMYFDANGEFFVVPMVDPSYGIHDLTFQAWAIGRDGKKLVRSGAVELALR